MDAAERALMSDTVCKALADAGGAADERGATDAILAAFGWLELLDAEPGDAIGIVFTALGATNATATIIDDVVVSALGREPRADLAVLLPPYAAWQPPGRIEDGRVHAAGLASARVAGAETMLIPCRAGAELVLVTIPTAAADISALRGIDPAAGLQVVSVDHAVVDVTAVDADAWNAAVALGRRAIAHEIAGACRTMLTLAVEHALGRMQFGRPVAQFQAVRHRLADALVAVEALDATLDAAAVEATPVTAALAKAVAGNTARTVAGHCQQVLAGVGFTTDHPFHRFLKRTIAVEGLFGSADEIVVDLGRGLLGTRIVPTLIDL